MKVNSVDSTKSNSNGTAGKVIAASLIGAAGLPVLCGLGGIGIVGSFGAIGIGVLEQAVLGGAAAAAIASRNKKHAKKPSKKAKAKTVKVSKEDTPSFTTDIDDLRQGRF